MSSSPIFYSTIEEAWGTPRLPKGKKKARVPLQPTDPLCDLYNKRTARAKKPYSEDAGTPYQYEKVFYDGYEKTATSRTTRPNNCKARVSAKPVSVSREKDVYDAYSVDNSLAQYASYREEDDEAYFSKVLNDSMQKVTEKYTSGPLHSDVTPGTWSTGVSPIIKRQQVDDDDGVSTSDYVEDDGSDIMAPASPAPMTPQSPSPSRYSGVEDDERDKVLDFGLYVASGIMLIFLLEQILQLGMRMKA